LYDGSGSILSNPTGPHPNSYGQPQQMFPSKCSSSTIHTTHHFTRNKRYFTIFNYFFAAPFGVNITIVLGVVNKTYNLKSSKRYPLGNFILNASNRYNSNYSTKTNYRATPSRIKKSQYFFII